MSGPEASRRSQCWLQVKREMGMVGFLFWLECAMIPVFLPWAVANNELPTISHWPQFHNLHAWAYVVFVAIIGGLCPRSYQPSPRCMSVVASSVHLFLPYGSPRQHRFRQSNSSLRSPCSLPQCTGLRAYTENMVLQYNSALTLAAANILVQALTILLSIWLFSTVTSMKMDAGILLSVFGYAVYQWQKTSDRVRKKALDATGEARASGEGGQGEATPLVPATDEGQGRAPSGL